MLPGVAEAIIKSSSRLYGIKTLRTIAALMRRVCAPGVARFRACQELIAISGRPKHVQPPCLGSPTRFGYLLPSP